jgi:NAD+ synthase
MSIDAGAGWAQGAADWISRWIADQVESAGVSGTVVGVSGGIDSAVVAGLCRRAVGDKAWGLILPCHSDPRDVEDARAVAAATGIRVETVSLDGAYDELMRALDGTLAATAADGLAAPGTARLAGANLKPRLRMSALYYFANLHNLLVVGTANRAETYVGYATKYGDAGVDIQPISGLLKREVREMASFLGIPARVIDRPPSAGLWAGQTDEGEMGITYRELDEYLATGSGPESLRERVELMHRRSAHKRAVPPSPPPRPAPFAPGDGGQ